MIIVKKNWREVGKLINGTATNAGWIDTEDLDMIFEYPQTEPREWTDEARWSSGNCFITLKPVDEQRSTVELSHLLPELYFAVQTMAETVLDNKYHANDIAWNTFSRLLRLLRQSEKAGLQNTLSAEVEIGAPWKLSRPKNKKRDQIIWERREGDHTWEEVAEFADCSINTAKENYNRMKKMSNLKTS